ncbi:MAG: hypothetical protein JWL88_523 [Parcubacteria group bacterium]|nr:hypothetical protein [Parcubacteria group bacterium]
MAAKRIIGIACLIAAIVLVVVVLYKNSSKSGTQLVFSPTQMLNALWDGYKTEYLETGTLRTLDKQRDNVTTSEGESYTLLRAVWMSDKPTFDTSWKWTQDNLQHKNDHLFSWLFGKQPSGTYGILSSQGGQNAASDADQDIALSLIFAYGRWQDPAYLASARLILADIWNKEVIIINGTPYLAANDLEKTSTGPTALMDISYLSPAEYRIFARVDTAHPWTKLADSSYDILNASIDAKLDATSTAELPPDWVQIDKKTGAISATSNKDLTTNFGYDAFRSPWRIALDYQWFGTARAKATLDKMSFLAKEWNANKKLAAQYTHAGQPLTTDEAPAMYGGTIGYFIVSDPAHAAEVYQTKLAYLFDGGKNGWHDTLSYYDSNWAWFGIALYAKQLPNLVASLPDSLFTTNP